MHRLVRQMRPAVSGISGKCASGDCSLGFPVSIPAGSAAAETVDFVVNWS